MSGHSCVMPAKPMIVEDVAMSREVSCEVPDHPGGAFVEASSDNVKSAATECDVHGFGSYCRNDEPSMSVDERGPTL